MARSLRGREERSWEKPVNDPSLVGELLENLDFSGDTVTKIAGRLRSYGSVMKAIHQTKRVCKLHWE